MTELETFVRDFRLSTPWSAQLFGVSPRTVRRWRRRGRVPRHAQNMIDVVREQTPPINHSLHRGPSVGVLIHSWRSRFYGEDWRTWMPAELRELYAARARQAVELEAARRDEAGRRRAQSLRRYWRRRRGRRA